jgi:uncharacterized protein
VSEEFGRLLLAKLVCCGIFRSYKKACFFLLTVTTINQLDITYYPVKDELNVANHGVSLELAAELDWSEVVAYVDTRRDYCEVREVGFGVVDGRLYCVVFTQRGRTMRVISMRKANKREIRSYVEQT